jgi:hypothetical protein
MASSARLADRPRARRWSRELIIEKIREWNDRYGEPPCSADWNPSLARWRAQEWRAERYREGIWPSTNAAKRRFDGSFDAAVRAAGLEPRRPGPRRGGAGAGRPAVAQRDPAPPRALEDEIVAAHDRIRAAEARAAGLERRLERAQARVRRAEEQVAEARRRARAGADQRPGAPRAREGGGSGPAVLAAALKGLAGAHASADRAALDAALAELASAAVRWRDRL